MYNRDIYSSFFKCLSVLKHAGSTPSTLGSIPLVFTKLATLNLCKRLSKSEAMSDGGVAGHVRYKFDLEREKSFPPFCSGGCSLSLAKARHFFGSHECVTVIAHLRKN